MHHRDVGVAVAVLAVREDRERAAAGPDRHRVPGRLRRLAVAQQLRRADRRGRLHLVAVPGSPRGHRVLLGLRPGVSPVGPDQRRRARRQPKTSRLALMLVLSAAVALTARLAAPWPSATCVTGSIISVPRGRAARGDGTGRPAPRDHRDRRPGDEGRRRACLLFSNVKGSELPVLINQFATERRTCMAFGVDRLDELGERVQDVLEMTPPEGMMDKIRALGKLKSLADSRPKVVRSGPCQEVVLDPPDLDEAADDDVLAGGRRRLHHAARGDHAATRAPACATSACTGSSGSTRPPPRCTGRSTRTPRPTGGGWARGWTSPSPSGSTRSPPTRPPRRCPSTSTS